MSAQHVIVGTVPGAPSLKTRDLDVICWHGDDDAGHGDGVRVLIAVIRKSVRIPVRSVR